MDEHVGSKKTKTHRNNTNSTRWAFFKRSFRKESRKMKLLGSGFKWKRLTSFQISFLDNFLFKIVSMLEGVVLGTTLCFFFLCFGCHFWNFRFLCFFLCFFFFFLVLLRSMNCKNLGFHCDFLVGNSLVLFRSLNVWMNEVDTIFASF